MTKKQFTNYKKELTYCESCKRILPTTNFMYSSIRVDGTATECKYCAWIKRHGGIPIIAGYKEQTIVQVLEFLLFDKSKYINDLSNELKLPLRDTVNLVQKLKVGNKACYVKSYCDYCKQEIENKMNVYMKNKNLYCSLDCYWKHKPETIGRGENNICYNRIATNCTNCGKEIHVIPYDYNKTNEFGDNHNFCSQECYWQYRSKYYVGEKSNMYNHEYTEEQKENSRIQLLNRLKKDNRLDTSIQLKVNDILDRNKILYEREKTFDYYSVDNYLNDSNLIIEVMGDYWHCNPNRYNKEKYFINETQQKQLHRDKIKYSYIKNHFAIDILYLWESDINKSPDLCDKLIRFYINNNGIIPNYHSFNWELINDELCLKDKFTIPYQDMSVNNYRNLIKKKVG